MSQLTKFESSPFPEAHMHDDACTNAQVLCSFVVFGAPGYLIVNIDSNIALLFMPEHFINLTKCTTSNEVVHFNYVTVNFA